MSTEKYRKENKEYINIKKREWYKNNSDKVVGEVSNRKRRLRDWLNNYKSEKCCVVCGESHTACLDFHHTNPDEKEINPSQMVNMGWGKERIMKEISKCIILCANCHRKLHHRLRNDLC